MTSAMPPAHSRAGSVPSSSGSQSTAAGCQNAPTSFLAATLIAVLPPIAASTWPTRVEGTAIHGRPRRNVAAAKPPTSVTEPPPAHTTTSLRSSSCSARARQMRSSDGSDLTASPPLIAITRSPRESGSTSSAMPMLPAPSAVPAMPTRVQTCCASAPAMLSAGASASAIASAAAV